METKQQQEALDYFKSHAKEWHDKAKADTGDEFNIIKRRNDYVLKVIEQRESTGSALDVGCGSGDLVVEIAKKGIRATGVDFAEEMIDIAVEKAKNAGCSSAEFACCSIFDFDLEQKKFDVISANGFIEYISIDELDRFLELSNSALENEGSLVVGSRNRLFNLFSLNEYTEDEIKINAVELLLSEAMALAKALEIDELAELETAPMPVENQEQLDTGIDVSTRYQYTPVQLIKLLKAKGLSTVHIYPVHIHGVIPRFGNKHPSIHGNVANLLQNYADGNISLISTASTFMLHARKV